MSGDSSEKPIKHLTLLKRRSHINDEFGFTIETSLFRSEITGGYMIEQINYGRHETLENTIALNADLIAEFLPFLLKIAENGREKKLL